MSIKYIILIGLVLLIVIGCNRKTNTAVNDLTADQKIEKVAKSNFADGHKLLYSKDKSNVCIYTSRKGRASSIYSTNAFVLYNVAKDDQVFKGQHNRVSGMTWIDNETIKFETVAGMIKDNESGLTHHIYNLSTREKSSKEGK